MDDKSEWWNDRHMDSSPSLFIHILDNYGLLPFKSISCRCLLSDILPLFKAFSLFFESLRPPFWGPSALLKVQRPAPTKPLYSPEMEKLVHFPSIFANSQPYWREVHVFCSDKKRYTGNLFKYPDTKHSNHLWRQKTYLLNFEHFVNLPKLHCQC